jgi:hypothetical protein
MVSLMNSRGSIFDLFLISVIFLTIIITCIIIYSTVEQIKTPLVASGANASFFTQSENTFNFMDEVIAFGFFSIMLVSIVSAFFINSHPIFFIVSIISTAVLVIVSGVVSGTFVSIASQFAETAHFPLCTLIMQNLVTIMIIYAVAISLAMYAKSGGNNAVY